MKNEIVEKALKLSGYKGLNPVQELAIEKGLLDQKNMIIATPTASGKTLCAVIAGLNSFLNGRGKMIYLCPLVALAWEKYQSFKRRFSELGIKVALSIGDYDSSERWLADFQWIIASNEKADSLIRHGASWIKDVDLIVVDEIHLLTDPSRGPTLEILLTRLREMIPRAQVLGLSATINNAKELARWLDAAPVISEWRPVKLYEGVCHDSRIVFQERRGYELDDKLPIEAAITDNTLTLNKQALFFVATRRSAEALAEKLGRVTKKSLKTSEKETLQKISDDVLNVLESPTRQCKRLAKCVKNGVTFHHAGCVGKQKRLIEEGFKEGLIKIICCTPTLAMGISYPTDRCVIRDTKRYYGGYGVRYIPTLEYFQIKGRAGRPEYSSFGESILVAKSEDEAHELTERYILGEPEEIHSKLALEPVLRMHVLALIASRFIETRESLISFFEKTFYAHQYGDVSRLEDIILDVLDKLVEYEFLVFEDGKIKPTRLGKRVSELYIDPLTAHEFVESLKRAMKIETNELSYLQMMSNALEMRPMLSVRSGEFQDINNLIATNEERFLRRVPPEWDLDFEDFLRSVKTSLMFDAWINEMTEDKILSKFKVRPGELRARLRNADWLLYASHELALLLGFKELLKDLRKLRVRMKYGAKEELIPLVKLEKIGRHRARKLYSNGLKSMSDLRKIPLESLKKVIGPKIAVEIKRQLGEEVEKPREERQKTLKF